MEFRVGELFKVSGTKTTMLDDLNEFGDGKSPYITTQKENNGMAGLFNFSTEKGNCLTIDSACLGFCAYQENDFSASDHVEKLTPKFNGFNKFLGLFFSTLINQENYKYSYGRKYNQERIKDTIINLPTTPQGEPDWERMEKYVRRIFG